MDAGYIFSMLSCSDESKIFFGIPRASGPRKYHNDRPARSPALLPFLCRRVERPKLDANRRAAEKTPYQGNQVDKARYQRLSQVEHPFDRHDALTLPPYSASHALQYGQFRRLHSIPSRFGG